MLKASYPNRNKITNIPVFNRTFHRRPILALLAAFAISAKIVVVSALRHQTPAFVAATAAAASKSWKSNHRGFATAIYQSQSSSRLYSSTNSNMASESSCEKIPKNLRGLFGGSGVEGMSNPLMNQQILDLLPPEKKASLEDVKVLYLGTATYDIATFGEKQTARFRDNGCQVNSLDVAQGEELPKEAIASIEDADIVLVSGGNTLYAVDRWNHLGLVPHLRAAMERGCILTGGSAGAICWFDSGHSDSADPETYREPMIAQYGTTKDDDDTKDESSEYNPEDKKEWKYLRVPGLGFVPGPFVCCPHHDKTQSNGLLRAHDFDEMLLARARSSKKSVLGLGIDHYSAFIVEGDNYKVYVLPEKPGSVSKSNDGSPIFDVDDDGTPKGIPGVWLKRVLVGDKDNQELVVEAMVCPSEGKLVDLLSYGGDNLPGQANIETDDNQGAVETCRKENPSGLKL